MRVARHQRTLTGRPTAGAQVLARVPEVPWHIRTTLGQHCAAERRLALKDVYSPKAIGSFFVVVERDSGDLLSVESLSCLIVVLMSSTVVHS